MVNSRLVFLLQVRVDLPWMLQVPIPLNTICLLLSLLTILSEGVTVKAGWKETKTSRWGMAGTASSWAMSARALLSRETDPISRLTRLSRESQSTCRLWIKAGSPPLNSSQRVKTPLHRITSIQLKTTSHPSHLLQLPCPAQDRNIAPRQYTHLPSLHPAPPRWAGIADRPLLIQRTRTTNPHSTTAIVTSIEKQVQMPIYRSNTVDVLRRSSSRCSSTGSTSTPSQTTIYENGSRWSWG